MRNAFWQTVVHFDRTRLTPEIALRNTVGIVAPLVLGAAMGNPSAGAVAALGALNVCYSDSRGILRVAGTLAGLLVATLAYYLLPGSLPIHVALLAAFTILLRWLGPANYGVFVAAVSGIIVLLMALAGIRPDEVIVPRAINTALGGTLALLAYIIWPTWERTQIGSVLGDLLDAYRAYFEAVMTAPVNRELRVAPGSHRHAGRLARSNAEASASRFLAEPGVSPAQRALLTEMLISSHAFARAAMAIESDNSARTAASVFTLDVIRALELMATAFREGTALPAGFPNLREAWTTLERTARTAGEAHSLLVVETDRVATSLSTLREQQARWVVLHRAG